jgi:mannose-6-phosphate isomerase-like protein (cupin superfamily)
MNSKPQHVVTKRTPAFVVKTGKDHMGGPLNALGVETSVKISSNDSGGAYSMMEASYAPNSGPPLHLHHREDEWWYILEGNFVFEIDGERVNAGPGDTVFGPRGHRHTLLNIGSGTGKTLVTVVPGGLDKFFQELSVAVPPGATPDPAVIQPIFTRYGLELLGPPLNK